MTGPTISNGVDDFTPLAVTDYEASSDTRNVFHSPNWVTIDGEGPRSGILPCVFATLTAAAAAWEIMAGSTEFTFADPDLPALDMTFVRDGEMTLRIHPELRSHWILQIGYREVLP